MQWPFKHLKKNSSWPMQPFVVQFAAAVISAPPNERVKFAAKMIERCLRMGARLAVEFDMPPVLFVEIAKAQIIREGGDDVKQALKEAFGEEVVKTMEGAEEAAEAIEAQVAAIFAGKGEAPEA